MNPEGWTQGDEAGYQQELANLKARIDAAGPDGDSGVARAALQMLSDPDTGRQFYLKAKANGWL